MQNSKIKINYAGEATSLITLGEQNFLTDPNFSKEVLFRKRGIPPSLGPQDLPSLSGLLISRANYENCDLFSLKYFKTTLPLLVPQGMRTFLQKFFPNPVVEIPAWNFHRQGETEVHAVPVRCKSYRILPWNARAATAFVLKSPSGTVYFSAATGYGPHFNDVASIFSIDVALLPVSPALAQGKKDKFSLDPEQFVQAAKELGAKKTLAVLGNNFTQDEKKIEETIRLLEKRMAELQSSPSISILKAGESWGSPE